MATITDYFEQAQLSMAAYASLQRNMPNADYRAALVAQGMSARQAETFANTYTVIDQYNDPSGFSATVFDKDGVKYFAIRGTENLFSFAGAQDWLNNVNDIGVDGIATGQGLALFNYLQRLVTPPGQMAIQVEDVSPEIDPLTGQVLDPGGIRQADPVAGLGFLTGTTGMTVTGHSLGGQLAMMMSRFAPNLTGSVYTYNAPGFDPPTAGSTSDAFFNLLRDAATSFPTGPIGTDWNSTIMFHLVVPGDVVQSIGDIPGSQQRLFSETADQGPIVAHSIRETTDALALYNLFAQLDPTLNTNPTAGLSTLFDIFQAAAGTGRKTLENVLDSLRTLFQINYAQGSVTTNAPPTFADSDSLYTNLYALEAYLKTTPFYNATTQSFNFTLDALTNRDAATLAANAQTDIGTRYALYKLNPFVVNNAPALYSVINGNGALDLYNATTRTGTLTTEYLKDRANFLYNKIQANNNDHDITSDATALATTWVQYAGAPQYFEDNGNYLPYKLYLGADASIVNQPINGMNQIKFGSNGTDTLTGSTQWDKLYGNAGNDQLTGGGGNDYLEGGQGNDTYYYRQGDGTDTILDTDGIGRLVYIDAAGQQILLTGGRQTESGSNLYTTASQPNIVYRKEPNGDLTIVIDGTDAITLTAPLLSGPSPTLGLTLEATGGTLLIGASGPAGPANQPVITGTAGDDNDYDNNNATGALAAGYQTDTIYGLGGDDTLLGYVGQLGTVQTLALYGGSGNDGLYADSDSQVGYDGNAQIAHFGEIRYPNLDTYVGWYHTLGPADFERAFGQYQPGPGARLFGEDGNDYLHGSLRDDTLDGGAGPDALYGNAGDDTLLGDGAIPTELQTNDWLDGGPGRDYLIGGAGNDYLLGGERDILHAPAGVQGDDLLEGGAGDDYLYGDSGTWGLYRFDGTVRVLDAPAVNGAQRLPIILDALEAWAGNDTLLGGDGNDQLYGGAGDDLVDGGNDNDRLEGEGGSDFLYGGAGNDILIGGESSATAAQDAADWFVGQYVTYYWRQRRTGIDGDDYLDGGTGNDRLLGGAGNDTYIFNVGDGQDVIGGQYVDGTYGETGGTDLVQLNLRSTQATLGYDPNRFNNLSIVIPGSTDSIELVNWADRTQRIETVRFNDGTTWDLEAKLAQYGLRVANTGDTVTDDGANTSYVAYFNPTGTNGVITVQDSGGTDNLYLSGAAPSSVTATRNGERLVLTDTNGNRVFLDDWYSAGGTRVETVRFADGTQWDTATLEQLTGTRPINGSGAVTDTSGNSMTYAVYLGPDVTEGFNVTLNDVGGTNDALRFEPVLLTQGPLGAYYLRPTLTGMARDGDDLVINLTLDSDVAGVPEPTGTVRIVGHYTGANRIETIAGLNVTGTVLVNQETATQVAGTYVQTSNIRPDYIVHHSGIISYAGITDMLRVGTGTDDTLGAAFDPSVVVPYRFYGHEGDDTLIGANGADTFNGGAGNDYMEGKRGNDTYYIDPADADTILDYSGTDINSRDTLRVADGVTLASLAFARSGNDLFIGNTRVQNYFVRDTSQIDIDRQTPWSIERLEGNTWSIDLPTHLGTLGLYGFTGTAGNDTLYGNDFDNVLSGLAGHDVLNGRAGNDTLLGGAGVDNLSGGPGDDFLDGGNDADYLAGDLGNDILIGGLGGDWSISGGAGNDDLDGGAGNDNLGGGGDDDIYRFSRGGGVDTIREYDNEGTADTLVFGAGITPADIAVQWDAGVTYTDEWGDTQVSPSRLWIDIGGNEGVLIEEGGSGGTDFEVEQFQFADSTVLTLPQLLALDTDSKRIGVVPGTPDNDVLQSGGWYDALYGYDGADLLIGGARSNQIFAGAGNDVLIGRGDIGYNPDSLDGGGGSDLYLFNPGDLKAYVNEAVETGGNDIDTFSFGGGIRPEDLDAVIGFEDYGDGTSSTWIDIRLRTTGETIGATLQQVYYDDLGNLVTENRRMERIQFLGNGSDQVFDFTGLIAARDADLRAGYDPNTPTFIPLFRPQDLTTYNLTGTVPFAREDLARQYATTGSVPLAPLTNGDIIGTAAADTLTGTSGDDRLYGLADNDTLTGNAGNDLLDGGTGADTMNGGTGNDTYIVDNTGDIVTESSSTGGTDTVLSSVTRILGTNQENLTLTGTSAINATGNSLANTLIGNTANNTLNGGAGADRMEGGLGNDTYTVDNVGDTVIENANEGTDTVSSAVTYTLSPNVENLTLTGTGAINATGNTLDNVLTGNSANNTLAGGAGNDTLNGGSGSDTMIGGIGNDTYVVNVSTDIVTESAGEGTDTVQASITYTLGNNVENLTLTGTTAINATGNTLDNVLTGNSAANTLTGNAGNDWLDGGAGTDTMIGGQGNDTYVVSVSTDVITENTNEGTDTVQTAISYTLGANVENLNLTGSGNVSGTGNTLNNTLVGNAGSNTLTGNAGNDTLNGGAGTDTLNGGTGNDTYIFNRTYGQDTITDNDTTAGNQDTVALGVNPLDIVFTRATNNLQLNVHGGADRLTVNSWYTNASYQTEVIRAADGRTLLNTQVDQLIQAMAQFSADNGGITWDQAIEQNPGGVEAVLAGYWQAA